MTHEELKYKESVLRDCFKHELESLNVAGVNDVCRVKEIKTVGILWHLTHQLCIAEENDLKKNGSVTTAETMDIKATGLKMTGSVK